MKNLMINPLRPNQALHLSRPAGVGSGNSEPPDVGPGVGIGPFLALEGVRAGQIRARNDREPPDERPRKRECFEIMKTIGYHTIPITAGLRR